MLLEHLAKHITELVVILQIADLGDHTETLKGFIVQLVNEGEVRVGYDNVGKLLDVSKTMRKSGESQFSNQSISSRSCSGLLRLDIPGGQLRPHVVCGANQSGLGQGAAKESQLPETNRPDRTLYPSARYCPVSYLSLIQYELRSHTHPPQIQAAMAGVARWSRNAGQQHDE